MSNSSSTVPTGPISLPLLKYSYATDPSDATKFSWKHELNEVLVVFDNYGADRYGRHPSSIMKVLQGAQLLDHIDLIEKVRECSAAIKHALEVNVQLKADQLPTSALYRRMSSTIALRYSLPDNKIRRLQLKFTSVQDFDTALAILDDVGCHLHNSAPAGEPGSTALIRPVTTSSALSRVTEQSQQINPIHQPSSSSSSHPFHVSQNASDERFRDIAPSFQPRERDSSEDLRRSYNSSQGHFQASQNIHRSFTSSFEPPPQNVHSLRPSTPLSPIHENRPSIYSDPVLQNIGVVDTRPRRTDPLRPRSAIPLSNSFNASSIQSDPSVPSAATDSRMALTGSSRFFSTSSQSHLRPSTAPFSGTSVVERDITIMIPPRRELPFNRPGSSRDGSSSSRTPTANALRPLPAPTFAQSSSSNVRDTVESIPLVPKAYADNLLKSALEDKLAPSSAHKRRTSTVKESPCKAPALARRASAKPRSRGSTTALDDSSSTFRSSSPARPRTALTKDPGTSHDPQIVIQQEQTPPTSSQFRYLENDTSHHFQAIDPPDVHTSNSTQQHPSAVPAALARPNPNSLPLDQSLQRSLARINKAFSNTPEVAEANKENLASYATMSHADRMSIVENMIITSVSDENFAVLAEDVYGCWQRIGFNNR